MMQGNDLSSKPVTVWITENRPVEFDSLQAAVSARMTPIELIEVLAERYKVDSNKLANMFTVWISQLALARKEVINGKQ